MSVDTAAIDVQRSNAPLAEPILVVRDAVQEFVVRGRSGAGSGIVHALSGVSLDVRRGETLGVVGESGSGKSTLVRSILQAPPPKAGSVLFRGSDLTKQNRRELLATRRYMQTVFQDPFGSLDPRWTVSTIVREPLDAYGLGTRRERRDRGDEMLHMVGLDPTLYGQRRPSQLSGGQCQRVAIARALVLGPSLLICDEAVSSLDVLSQARVLNLFEDLRSQLGLSYLFVAHDLAMVKQVSDRVAVMYLGRMCEVGPSQALYTQPRHPYTAALLDSTPKLDPGEKSKRRTQRIVGEVASPLDPPSGCRFRTRCPRAEAKCAAEVPELSEIDTNHTVACHFPLAAGSVSAAAPSGTAAGNFGASMTCEP